jgi:uncharacterized membrane-anchored protein
LIETLKSPEDAVLPTFLETTKSKKIEVSPKEKEILELKSGLDSLRREVRSRKLPLLESDEIEPEEVIEQIKRYLKIGMPEEIIARKLKPLGPPTGWTLEEIKKIRKEVIERIKRYLEIGMPEEIIARKLKPLGPPTEWILREIKKIREKQSR